MLFRGVPRIKLEVVALLQHRARCSSHSTALLAAHSSITDQYSSSYLDKLLCLALLSICCSSASFEVPCSAGVLLSQWTTAVASTAASLQAVLLQAKLFSHSKHYIVLHLSAPLKGYVSIAVLCVGCTSQHTAMSHYLQARAYVPLHQR
jgi:hypothetical protein